MAFPALLDKVMNKADTYNPILTGTPQAPTANAGTNTTQIATTEFVTKAVANKTDITGNAATATKLATACTITLTGDVTGSVSFDGSANASITAVVTDDSHNHTIANVDNLQTTLNAKAALNSPALTGTPTAPTAATTVNNTQIATTAYVTTAVANKTDITGNAATATTANSATTATKLATARTIALSGAVSGSTAFDGSDNVTITTISGIVSTTATISTTWTGSAAPYTQTISASGVTATSIVEVSLPSTATDEQVKAYQTLNWVDGGQTTNAITLRAYGEKNTIAIPINVVIHP